MIVDVSTFLPVEPSKVEAQLRTSRLLIHVASPLIKFLPYGDTQLPETWKEGTYWVSLRLLGFIPFGKQAVVISYPELPGGFSLRDDGHSMLIKKWDHRITIVPSGTGTLYRDYVAIEAGALTVFVWAFAQLFYRHRQRRWRQLVASGFHYAAS
tara:strand:- start:793 stop:1254 length:462 start_codon:yes stop_codon:yes gene_type:complete